MLDSGESVVDTPAVPAPRLFPRNGVAVILLGGGTLPMAAPAPSSPELFLTLSFDVPVVHLGEVEELEGLRGVAVGAHCGLASIRRYGGLAGKRVGLKRPPEQGELWW